MGGTSRGPGPGTVKGCGGTPGLASHTGCSRSCFLPAPTFLDLGVAAPGSWGLRGPRVCIIRTPERPWAPPRMAAGHPGLAKALH